MRRVEREITDSTRAYQILQEARILRVAYVDREGLTMVPITFMPIVEDGKWYLLLHGAKGGRKYAAWKDGLEVCFEAESRVSPVVSDEPSQNSWHFLTIVGHGVIREVTDNDVKHIDLARLLLSHNKSGHSKPLPDDLSFLACYRLEVTDWTAKQNGFA